MELAQGVDRVRRAVAVDVDAADREVWVGGRRDDGHQVAILSGRDPTLRLLPWLTGRDEDDFVEVESGPHFAGGHEVAMVNRVERAAHHPDTAPRSLWRI